MKLYISSARKPNLGQRKVNVDFPVWMIESLDRTARRMGVTRQLVIKIWLAERLEREAAATRLHAPVASRNCAGVRMFK